MTPFSDRHDHAPDLSWIIGTAQRVNLEGGFWELVFAGDDAPFGGHVVLGRPDSLAGVEGPTLVRVTGRPAPETMTVFMAGTAYDLDELEVLDGE